ncbi:hypothetical protein [Nostoc favosum]|uniref:Uncharacterized protein n=1 Tax=Nostoc favosum CHAB5714 TaxID=2780399 RepID=A0ABS8IME8_9NOSO|nr:hypothetical protein [Nostoc favosum]MCC5604906.1 hypothetical protein [Nostoc favosum CHAB5714]
MRSRHYLLVQPNLKAIAHAGRLMSVRSRHYLLIQPDLTGLKQKTRVKKGIMLSQRSFHVEKAHERNYPRSHAAML